MILLGGGQDLAWRGSRSCLEGVMILLSGSHDFALIPEDMYGTKNKIPCLGGLQILKST